MTLRCLLSLLMCLSGLRLRRPATLAFPHLRSVSLQPLEWAVRRSPLAPWLMPLRGSSCVIAAWAWSCWAAAEAGCACFRPRLRCQPAAMT
jgi:hypothetical protein